MSTLHLFQRPAAPSAIAECARSGDVVVLMGRAVTALDPDAARMLSEAEGEIAVLDQGLELPDGLQRIAYADLVHLTERCAQVVCWP